MTEQKTQQSITKPPFQPRPPINTFVVKYSFPEKKIDDALIEKLFLFAAEGDIMKVKSFVLTNQIALSVRRENGQNVLHVILDNTNTTALQKMEMVQFALDFGANVNAFTTGNITPLHLAAKNQLVEICEYLIKNGADVNALDSQQKTPLFYAITGTETECPVEEEIKPFIPEDKSKHQERISISQEIYNLIIDFVDADHTIKIYRDNAKLTIFNNIDLKIELADEIKKIKNDISKLSVNVTDLESNKKKIRDSILSVKTYAIEKLKSKIVTLLSETSIGKVDGGWSPDGNNENVVLGYKTYNELIQNTESNIFLSFEEIKNNFSSKIDDIKNSSQNIYDTMIDFNYLLMSLLMFNVALHENRIQYVDFNDLIKVYNTDQFDMPTKNNDIEKLYLTTTDKYTILNLYTFHNLIENKNIRLKYKKNSYGSNSGYDDLPLTRNFLTENVDIKTAKPEIAFYVDKADLDKNDDLDNKDKILYYLLNDYYNGSYKEIDFFSIKYTAYVYTLKQNVAGILTNVINSDYVKKLINFIKDEQINYLNFVNCLVAIKAEIDNTILPKLNKIKDLFKSKKVPDYFIYDIINGRIELMIAKLNKKRDIIDDLYTDVNSIFTILNQYIEFYNKNNALNIIKNYYNRYTDSTYDIDGYIYDNNINLLDILPINIENIKSASNGNIKKYLIENFAFNVNSKNYFTYFNRTLSDSLPKMGYVNPDIAKYTGLKLRNNNHVDKVDDYEPLTAGKFGEGKDIIKRKDEKTFNSISSLLDDYLCVMKYELLTNILLKFKPADKIFNNVRDKLKEIIISEPTEAFIYSFIAKIIDNYIIDYFNSLIQEYGNYILSKVFEKDDAYIVSETTSLPKRDLGFSIGLNDLLNEYYRNHNIAILNVTNDTYLNSVQSNIHKLTNYSYSNKSKNFTCFNIDIKTAQVLLNKRTYVNHQDILGNVPLFYAMQLQHIGLIKLLLDNGAGKDFTNKSGKSIYTIVWDEYNQNVISKMINISELAKVSTDKIVTEINKKGEYGHNIIKYVENIIPIFLYLLNHQIFMSCRRYPLNWTYEMEEKINKTLGIDKNNYFPLFENAKSIKEVTLNGDDINDTINKLNSINSKKISELETRKKQFEKEIIELKDKIDELSIYKYNSYIIKLNKLNDEINSIKNKIDKTKFRVKNLDLNGVKFNKSSSSAISLYDSVYEHMLSVTNANTRTYQKIFEDYIDGGFAFTDNVQLITRLFDYQKKNNGPDNKENLNNINQFTDIYKNVLEPFGKNYFDLQQEINGTNYSLTYVVNIIRHVTQHFILASLYRVIIKVISKYLSETTSTNKLADNIDDVLQFNNYILFNNVVIRSPLRLVKSVLGIYDEYETDYDKNYSFDEFKNDINNVLKTNPKLGNVNDESSLIKNLEKYVYPFYKDWIEMFVNEMKGVSDVYIRNILFQSKYIKTIELICKD